MIFEDPCKCAEWQYISGWVKVSEKENNPAVHLEVLGRMSLNFLETSVLS
jgi:hypothetical protein